MDTFFCVLRAFPANVTNFLTYILNKFDLTLSNQSSQDLYSRSIVIQNKHVLDVIWRQILYLIFNYCNQRNLHPLSQNQDQSKISLVLTAPISKKKKGHCRDKQVLICIVKIALLEMINILFMVWYKKKVMLH